MSELLDALYDAAEVLDSVKEHYIVIGEMERLDAIQPTIRKVNDAIAAVNGDNPDGSKRPKTIVEMMIEEMADKCALDFFTRAPRHRTRRQLRCDIEAVIRAAIKNHVQRTLQADIGRCACGEEIPWSWANEGDRQYWNEKHGRCKLSVGA